MCIACAFANNSGKKATLQIEVPRVHRAVFRTRPLKLELPDAPSEATLFHLAIPVKNSRTVRRNVQSVRIRIKALASMKRLASHLVEMLVDVGSEVSRTSSVPHRLHSVDFGVAADEALRES